MSGAPRVLVLGSVLGQNMGGVRRHNEQLLPRAARLLAERGGSLSILEGTAPCAFPLPATIERIPSGIPPRPILRRALAEGHALRRLLDERSRAGQAFDLVHTAHQPVPRGFDVPLALLIHDLRSLRKSHSPFSRRLLAKELLGRSAVRARCLMTVSESMADEMADSLGLDRETIRIIPNGADHFTPLPRGDYKSMPMLCVGHLEPRKNQALLLRALAHDPTLPPVDFVGEAKGNALRTLGELARELGVAHRVRFLGAVSDERLQELLAQTSCVVLPSTLEGFGIVAVEAMRARAPLALSRIAAHLEVSPADVPNFENTPEDCARAIRTALALGHDCLDRFAAATERYSWQAAAEKLVAGWCAAAYAAKNPSASSSPETTSP